MADVCSCNSGILNTGLPNCIEEIKEFRAMYLVQTFDSTGAKNKILSTDTVDDAFVLDKINEADTSKRWYPITELEEVGGERADAVYKTSNSGTQKFVKDGVRTGSAQRWSGDPAFEKAIASTKCSNISAFFVDANNKVIGIVDGEDLLPIRLQKSTLNCKAVFATGAEPQYWMLNWQWDDREKDYNLGYIEPSADCDMLSYNGLIDIESAVSNISQTGFTLTLTTKFGALGNKGKLTGLVAGDFYSAVGGTASRLYNVTDSTAVTISSVSETSDGVYVFTFSSQTVADVIRVTPVKSGYDFTAVIAKTVTIA